MKQHHRLIHELIRLRFLRESKQPFKDSEHQEKDL